jgi:hypothetical protein
VGKTVLCDDICYWLSRRRYNPYKRIWGKVNEVLIFSNTEGANSYWERRVSPLYIHPDYDHNKLSKLIKHKEEDLQIEHSGGPVAQPGMVILEDCMYAKKDILKEPTIFRLMFNGRHFRLYVMITKQYVYGLSRDIRTGGVDYVFASMEPNAGNRERLYKEFFGIIHNFRVFDKIFQRATQNFGVLVSHLTAHTYDVSKCVFWYRARPRNYRIETPEMRTFAMRHAKVRSVPVHSAMMRADFSRSLGQSASRLSTSRNDRTKKSKYSHRKRSRSSTRSRASRVS